MRRYPPRKPPRRRHRHSSMFTNMPKPKEKILLPLWYLSKLLDFFIVLALALPGLALIGFIIILIIVII